MEDVLKFSPSTTKNFLNQKGDYLDQKFKKIIVDFKE